MMINKKRKSFTLLETVVTITIYAAMLLMITNIVLLNAKLGEQLKMRSRIRSELSEISSLIKRDVRNATTIDTNSCTLNQCTMNVAGYNYIWRFNPSSHTIEKVVVTGMMQNSEFLSGTYLTIDSVDFSSIQDSDLEGKRVTVILTIKAKGKNDVWNVSNQLIQEIISTRNYELGL